MKKHSSPGDFLLFAEAWVLLAVSRLILVFIPFRKIVLMMQYKRKIQKPVENEQMILEQIQMSIARACARSPWRTKCFEQALTAKMMTRRRGLESVTYFGVKKSEDSEKIDAHAWVKSGEFVITGWQKTDDYTVVAVF